MLCICAVYGMEIERLSMFWIDSAAFIICVCLSAGSDGILAWIYAVMSFFFALAALGDTQEDDYYD